jgi:hypothetical protein
MLHILKRHPLPIRAWFEDSLMPRGRCRILERFEQIMN